MSSRGPGERQDAYWSRVAGTKPFHHPFDAARLAAHLPRDARVLDVGCGWGRTMLALRDAGWRDVAGADFADGMLRRGREEHPDLRLVRADARALPFADASFGGVVLLAVLTAIPRDEDQRRVAAEIRRVLRPGGVLYVSDLLVNDDDRNRARYAAGLARHGRYGVFDLPEGVTLRHHDRAWLGELFAGLRTEEFVPFTARTMNGNTSNAFQLFARR